MGKGSKTLFYRHFLDDVGASAVQKHFSSSRLYSYSKTIRKKKTKNKSKKVLETHSEL